MRTSRSTTSPPNAGRRRSAGASLEDVAAQVATRYQIDPATARSDVERFAQDLATERLVELDEASDATAPAPLEPVATRLPYVAPTVQKYDDLEDLLLLDPIHEVDEAGWPVPLAE